MKFSKLFYVLVCLTAGWTILALIMHGSTSGEFLPGAFFLVIATLTFPLGCLGMAVGLPLIYSGLITPTEFIALATPVCAALGYAQWFHLLPKLYRKKFDEALPEDVFN